MEYQKITNLLGNIPNKVPRFITKKNGWIKVHDQSETYDTNKQIGFKTSMLISDLCDYNDAYVVVEGVVTVSLEESDRYEMDRDIVIKNNAPFISCISKINGVLIENAKDLKLLADIWFFVELLQR